jgi:hypothetical protein
MHKVVARLADGRVVKGFTIDFFPDKPLFHINVDAAPKAAKPEELRTADLKALYFVKDFAGNPEHDERREFDQSQRPIGRKIRVVFKDGEEMVGTTQGYQLGRPGFFLVPADPASNTDRCYVVSGQAKSIAFI